MSLKIQILSLIISFIYGLFFNIILNINYKIIYNDNVLIQIIGSFLFIIANSLLYFYLLIKINNGIVHIYCLLMLLIGYLIMKKIKDKKI